MNIAKLLLHPLRLEIFQFALGQGDVTAKEISQFLSDVPRATIYRQINLLEQNGLLRIIQENRKRGTIEKVYRVDKSIILTQNPKDMKSFASAYFIGLLQETTNYLENPNANLEKDLIFFNSAILHITDEDYTKMVSDITVIVRQYTGVGPDKSRKTRKFSYISSFPVEGTGE